MRKKLTLLGALLIILAASGCVQQQDSAVNASLSNPFNLKVNETAHIESEGLGITFIGVAEDSRCPAGAECIRAGRATVTINVEKSGQDLGTIALSTEAGDDDIEDVDGYSVRLLAVEPHPQVSKKTKASDYVVTLVVSKQEAVPQEELSFETIIKGAYGSQTERKNYIVTSESGWVAILQKTDAELPAPIDFTKYTVLAAFQGEYPTGGYDIEITKVINSPEAIEVFVRETSPGPECIVTQAFTHPYHVVKIQKTDKKIVFMTIKEVTKC